MSENPSPSESDKVVISNDELKRRLASFSNANPEPQSPASPPPAPAESAQASQAANLDDLFNTPLPVTHEQQEDDPLKDDPLFQPLPPQPQNQRIINLNIFAGLGKIGESVRERREAWTARPEKFPRPFAKVQEDLRDFVNNPNQKKEEKLKKERQKLIDAAKSHGIFNGLKGQITKIQETYPDDQIKAYEEIEALSGANFEHSERLLIQDWDENFAGMLDEYKDVALLNMKLAMDKALGLNENESSGTIQNLKREISIRGWGEAPTDDLESYADLTVQKENLNIAHTPSRPSSPQTDEEPVPLTGGFSLENLVRAQVQALKIFYGEREASKELSETEFFNAERFLDEYKPEQYKQMLDRLQFGGNTERAFNLRAVMEKRFKMYQASFAKKTQAGTMTKVGESGLFRSISAEDIAFLAKNMIGYEFALQDAAHYIVHRLNINGKDSNNHDVMFALLDCQDQGDFKIAANYFEKRIAQNIINDKKNGEINKKDALGLAGIAFNTAINTLYALNVPEYYNTCWEGNIRKKYLESEGRVPSDRLGPTNYSRISAPGIVAAICPIDDLIKQALKPENKNGPAVYKWIIEQSKQPANGLGRLLGRKRNLEFKDFDEIVVLQTTEKDSHSYWKIKRQGRQRVLCVPPIAPIRLYGSAMHTAKINVEGSDKQVTFIEALAARKANGEPKYKIDWDKPGPGNFADTYADDAPKVDIVRSAYKLDISIGDVAKVIDALKKFKQNENMELLAWLYLVWSNGLNPKSRAPVLTPESFNNPVNNWASGNLRLKSETAHFFNIFSFLKNLPRQLRKTREEAGYSLPTI